MPSKFKQSERVNYKRASMSTHIPVKKFKHYYIKNTPKQELFDYINSSNAKPKLRVKCVNELTRRGVKIQWTSQSQSLLP